MTNGRGDSDDERIESEPDRWVSAVPAGAIEATAQAAEAVRTANHATLNSGDFDHQDLYRLIGELSCLAHRLPQLIDQVGDILRRLHTDGRIGVDRGAPADTVARWNDSTTVAVSVADDLARHIDGAFSELSAVKRAARS